jgi:hypothetical protein
VGIAAACLVLSAPGFVASTLLVPAIQAIQLPGSLSSESANGAARLFDAAAGKVLRK